MCIPAVNSLCLPLHRTALRCTGLDLRDVSQRWAESVSCDIMQVGSEVGSFAVKSAPVLRMWSLSQRCAW